MGEFQGVPLSRMSQKMKGRGSRVLERWKWSPCSGTGRLPLTAACCMLCWWHWGSLLCSEVVQPEAKADSQQMRGGLHHMLPDVDLITSQLLDFEQKFKTCMSTPCRVQWFLIGMLGSGQCLVNRCQPPKKALPMCQQRVSSLACLQQDLVGQEEWPIGQQWGVLLGWHAWGFLDICLALFLLRTKQGFQDPNLTSEPVSVLGVR